MLKMISTVLILLVFSSSISAAPIRGSGATSCGSWLKERRNGTYAIDLNWILGFVSAYNHYIYLDSVTSGNGIFGSADPEAVAAWMDNYCNANPLSTPYSGSVELIEELRKMKK